MNESKNRKQNVRTHYEVEDEIWMVPCRIDDSTKKYVPVVRPDVPDSSGSQRQS